MVGWLGGWDMKEGGMGGGGERGGGRGHVGRQKQAEEMYMSDDGSFEDRLALWE